MSHIKIQGKYLSWDEIYNLTGLVEEDFMYDPEGSFDSLVQARAGQRLARDEEE